ncbi:MAG: T9SS type A sorting domain-containing protein [Flavobacterium sp.]|nr:T9SS type A sorting domain-containing protein [Flavobacterium sp.]
MKKSILLPILIMTFNNNFAQLHIATDDYVYVSHDFLYVKEETSLDGNLYLRNEAQLLQADDTSLSLNRGLGILSVYQEGTSDNYEYNYWCAPVGNQNVYGSGNKNFWINMFYQPTSAIESTPAIVINHDIDGMDGVANPLSIADRWIYRLNSSSYYFQIADTSSGIQMAPGEGFTMKGTAGSDSLEVLGVPNNPGSNQRYDFRGSPNNGEITATLYGGYSVLTGNPYPSAIDLSMFLTDADACSGIAYFWEMDENANTHIESDYVGGYGTFAPVSRGGTGIYVPAVYTPFLGGSTPDHHYERRFSPIGQGFIIERISEGFGEITMKNIYRVFVPEGAENQSEFERSTTGNSGFLPKIQSISGFDYAKVSKAAVPQVRLTTTINGKWVRETALAFDENASDAVDHAMDARLYDKYPADSYFVIGRDKKEYVVDVMTFDIHKKIPIGFRNAATTKFEVSVKGLLNLSNIETVYLHDKKTRQYFDISKKPFKITLPRGVNNSQYELTFENDTVLRANPLTKKSIAIMHDNSSKNAVVQNKSNLALENLTLFDLNGKMILTKKLGSDDSYELSTSNLADGVYIARLTDALGNEFSKKINVKN